MGDQIQANSQKIVVTKAAAMRVAEIIRDEGNKNLMLRVAVTGGGCSGFQYDFKLEEQISEDDLVIDRDQVKVLIDSLSVLYLNGSEIDFVDDLVGASFQIRNPNATSSCGCGTSFSI